jgi:cytochrome c2
MREPTYGVTRSGYRYEIVSAADLVTEAGEHFAWTCRFCHTRIQGGQRGLGAHQQTVHAQELADEIRWGR